MTKQASASGKLGTPVNMTFDESSPLNQAYLKEVRTEDFAKIGNYDESTKYHGEAIGKAHCLFVFDMFT